MSELTADRSVKTVFISYSHEDYESAFRLYSELKEKGLQPWLDKESLLAGQVWREEINKAIKNSQFFIPILSSNSVEGRGYVRKELKEALDILDSISYSKIYVIPIRIDNCMISDRKVNTLHIVDLFPDWKQGFEKVLRAMGVENMTNFDWTSLLHSIHERKCTPFLGREAFMRSNNGKASIPLEQDLANRWAEKYDYPLSDSYRLSRVAQYMAVKEGDDVFPKELLSIEIKKITIPDFSLSVYRNTPHTVLADINSAVYFTTNYDHFMEEALKSRGKQPISDFCRWNEDLVSYAKQNAIGSYLYRKDDGLKITPGNPLVYHLYGDIDHPRSMVVTEKDYFDFVINLNRYEVKDLFPSFACLQLISNSLLLIGYSLDDIIFRTIIRSIVTSLGIQFRLSNILVMQPSELIINNKISQAQGYIEQYSKKILKMQPYWGDALAFSKELRHELDTFSNSY